MHLIRHCGKREQWMEVLKEKLNRYKPTGLLCGMTDDLSWVHYTCGQIGKKIPEDFSLIALETLKTEVIPDLSKPVLPVKETCDRAVDRMLWRIGNPSLPYEHIRIQGYFHKGKTVLQLPVV